MRIGFLNISLVVFLNLLAGISSLLYAQDEEPRIDTAPVITDTYIPEPAPFIFDETVPMPDKDSIRIRLKRLEKGMKIPMTFNNAVYSFIQYFTVRNREYSKMVLRRKDTYFPIFEKLLKEYDMPDELKYLSIVESGLNPRARSRAGAVGLWQFVPNTGQYYKLGIDWYIDDRQDPIKSTEAACKYLKYLYARFGQWELALAAYNCGPTNVSRAIKACRNKRDFWDVYYHLPRETRSYVPQFIAITYLMNHSQDHNLFAEYLEGISSYHTVYTDQYVNLEILAQQLGLCVDDLQKLNPTLIKNAVPAYIKNFPLKIPAEKYHILMDNYCSIMDSCSKRGSEDIVIDINPFSEKANTKASFFHVVKRGEILSKIARKYRVTASEIRTWNHIKGSKLKYGQRLAIWKRTYQKNDDKRVAAQKTVKRSTRQTRHIYFVQPGDTLWSICQKMDVPVSRLKKINRLKSNELKAGQKLILS